MILFGSDGRQAPFAEAQVVILPVPLELTVSYGKGTSQGPSAVLEASSQMEVFDEKRWRPFPTAGIHTLPPITLPSDPAAAVLRLAEKALEILRAGKFLVSLGGEHSVTVGLVQAAREVHPGLGVLQIDAHTDLRDEYQGSRFSHACAMRRVVEMGVPVHACGIRSVSREEAAWLDENPGHPRPVFDGERDAPGVWIDRLVDRLPAKVYLTIDIDGLDPALCPGTGTPEPGGLSFREAERLVEKICRERTLVAADVVEVSPIADQSATEMTAARLVARILQERALVRV